MTYDQNNVFARILRGELPCSRRHETEHALAFDDINPQTPVHVLVIPKGNYVDFEDFAARATPEEQAGFWQAVKETAEICGVAGQGFRLTTNNGASAGQVVFHFHVHIFGGRPLGRMVRPPEVPVAAG
ncbi:MAG: HIT domain-containing protein [Pseudomonadota bacterium]|nr:HIT domain-containing protein [Pseudomonadota bacterium]